jgi:hypothetical protein
VLTNNKYIYILVTYLIIREFIEMNDTTLSRALSTPPPAGCSAPNLEDKIRYSGLPQFEDKPEACGECPQALRYIPTGQFVCALALEMQKRFSDPSEFNGLWLDSMIEVPVGISNGSLPGVLTDTTGEYPRSEKCPLAEKLEAELDRYSNDRVLDEKPLQPEETAFISVNHPGVED